MTKTRYVDYVVSLEIDSDQCGDKLLKLLLDSVLMPDADELLPHINVLGSEIVDRAVPDEVEF